jgi:hypothetical protein
VIEEQDLLIVEVAGIMFDTVDCYDLGLFIFHFVFLFKVLPIAGGSFPLTYSTTGSVTGAGAQGRGNTT